MYTVLYLSIYIAYYFTLNIYTELIDFFSHESVPNIHETFAFKSAVYFNK